MTNTITETTGVDLGDRYSAYSVIDQATGTETDHGRIRTTLLFTIAGAIIGLGIECVLLAVA